MLLLNRIGSRWPVAAMLLLLLLLCFNAGFADTIGVMATMALNSVEEWLTPLCHSGVSVT